MPVKDERNLLLQALSTTLSGLVVQNFFILTGEGSNGKDTLVSKLLKATLGTDYFEYSNTCILTEKRKGALSQEIANLSKKRAVIWSEPPKQSILQGGPIKEMTGTDQINARGLYSKNTETQLNGSCFMLCNGIPRFDNMDGGVARRLIIIPFGSLFKNAEDIKNMSNLENVHEADAYFDSNEFRQKYKMSLFHLLAEHFQTFKKNKFLIKDIPKSIKEMNNQYIQDSDDFYSWFKEIYESDEKEFIQIKDVFKAYKQSDIYENLTKREKRLMTRKNMVEQIKKHAYLRVYYMDRYQPTVNGKQKNLTSILKGFKLKPLEEDEDEDKYDSDGEIIEPL